LARTIATSPKYVNQFKKELRTSKLSKTVAGEETIGLSLQRDDVPLAADEPLIFRANVLFFSAFVTSRSANNVVFFPLALI
jgi:hypothetical protein